MALELNGTTQDGFCTQSGSSHINNMVANWVGSFWVRPDSTKNQVIYRYFGLSGLNTYAHTIGLDSSGFAYFEKRRTAFTGPTTNRATTGNTVTNGAWNHILAYTDSTTNHIILNNGTKASATLFVPGVAIGNLFVGSNNTASEWFDGAIGECMEWDDFDLVMLGDDIDSIARESWVGKASALHFYYDTPATTRIVHYFGLDNAVQSWAGDRDTLTLTASPSFSSGPAIQRPWSCVDMGRDFRRIRLDAGLIRV